MVTIVRTLGLLGIEGYEVAAECDLGRGLPAFEIVGLPDAAVREARERVRAAASNSGFNFPSGRITVNLAPADRKKEGSLYDLPILVGLLHASGQIGSIPADAAFLGEISLSGELRPVHGVLSMALAAVRCGIRQIFVPRENAPEATLAEGLTVYPVQTLRQLAAHLKGEAQIEPQPEWQPEEREEPTPDFSDVRGQEYAKRALEIAAAGGHHLLMVGPPGAGKSMLAKRFASILPAMTREEALEVTQLWSVNGLLDAAHPLVTRRPFRAPHHTTSSRALAGGGTVPHPGEISLAHHGTLFLDELPEFSTAALEVLRQPLEDGTVQISRVNGSLTFPSRFQMICAMNPCRCGWYGHPSGRCTCTGLQVQKYLRRISGPMMDRVDIKVYVSSLSYEELERRAPGESSETIRQRVEAARERQRRRYAGSDVRCNARMGQKELRRWCRLDEASAALMRMAYEKLGLTARSYDRILRVARTIADLDGAEHITSAHLSEAIAYRTTENIGGV